MRRSVLLASSLLALLAALGCKREDRCEAHCGPCGGDEPLPYDTISPVRYGSDSQGMPVVELLYEAEGTCPGEATTAWMWWTGTPVIGAPAGKLDTSTASLEYLTALHSRAIVWHNVDLVLPWDQTWDAFTFSVIQGGEDTGTFRCAAHAEVIACKAD